jgi:predicted deacetylase
MNKKTKNNKKKKRKKIIILIGLIILALIPIFSLTRIILPSEIDDVHPLINCPEIEEYTPKILWVIPKFRGVPISENKEWCEQILSLNKKIGMHGITHEYKEFENNITKQDLEEGIKIFKDCFGFTPEKFKPPQLALSRENKELLKEYNLTIKTHFNSLTRKIYHCNDTGIFSNSLIRAF